MEEKKPTIVVLTYNRLNSLSRLLHSLNNSYYPSNQINLVISIDGGAPYELVNFVENFAWKYGNKIVIKHETNLGLRKHVISCGDLVYKYDEIIILEDDLYVSPFFYDYISNALDFYRNHEKIAGISLYSYSINEFNQTPFIPLYNGKSTYFMQVPSSWGQAWTRKQWENFKIFYNLNPSICVNDKLPEPVKSWPESSWKKYFYKYIVENDLYFVYPYISYSTNFAEVGVHYKKKSSICQVPIANYKEEYNFAFFELSEVLYDAYFDPSPFAFFNTFNTKDLCIDLSGLKQINLFPEENWLTIKKNTSNTSKSFGYDLLPIENNVLLNNQGFEIFFSKRKDILQQINTNFYDDFSNNYNTIAFSRGYNLGYNLGINLMRKYYSEKFLFRLSNKIYNVYDKIKSKTKSYFH